MQGPGHKHGCCHSQGGFYWLASGSVGGLNWSSGIAGSIRRSRPWVIGEYGSSPARDVDDVSSASIKDVGGKEQLVDLGGSCGVEFGQDYRGVAQDFGELRRGIGTDCADLGQGEGGQVQRQRPCPGGVEPGHRGNAPAHKRGQRGGVDDFAADHAAVSGATMCRWRISSSPG
jgi:hypothetical protein